MKTKVHIQLKEIFLENYQEWCTLAFSYLGDSIEAEEVVQDVCVNVLLKGEGAEIISLKAYIYIAIKNKCLTKIKKAKKFKALETHANLKTPSSEEKLIQMEVKDAISKAIASLPEPSKKVFNLCYLEGQKYQNVANALGISKNTVKYHMKKAFQTLRMELHDMYLFIFFFAILASFLA
ncbi:MAG: sigma-70 family RNA polymerase sigma factor [Flavobacteriaceae bacterium]